MMGMLAWASAKRLRPDPYEDWRKRIDPSSASPTRFLPVIAHLKRDATDGVASLKANLRLVLAALARTSGTGLVMRALPAVFERLTEIAAALEAVTDGALPEALAAPIVFKAYLREADVYSDGAYAIHDAFELLQAAPSIDAFGNPERRGGLRHGGAKVVMGVIDDGLAFANARFCARNRATGALATRISALWIQDIEEFSGPDDTITFGRVLDGAAIDRLLATHLDAATGQVNENAVYRDAGLKPDREETISLFRAETHGAHVMDLAAGEDPDSARSDRPIIAVQLPGIVTQNTSGRALAHYAGEALDFILREADRLSGDELLPVVVNFSYGYQAGPKDGSSAIERDIQRLVSERERRGGETIVVIPSGNSFEDRTNAFFSLGARTSETLGWVLPPDDLTESFAEIYIRADNGDPKAEISVTPPGGQPVGTLAAVRQNPLVLTEGRQPVAGLYVDRHAGDGPGQIWRVMVAVNRTNTRDSRVRKARPGEWQVTVRNAGTSPIRLHAMIQRDDTLIGYRLGGRQSVWTALSAHARSPLTGDYDHSPGDGPITGRGSISAISGGAGVHVVGAADDGAIVMAGHGATAADVEVRGPMPSPYTAAGLSPGVTTMQAGPDLSVPVDHGPVHVGLYASGARSGALALQNGTSVAAPIVARMLADEIAGRAPHAITNSANGFTDRLGDETITRSDGGHFANTARLTRTR